MASRMPQSVSAHWIELALGATAAALVAAAVVPSAADAKLFGAKKPPEDFTAVRRGTINGEGLAPKARARVD